ncbi:MAG: hypothetical protein ABIP71_01110 [Verrucomicrobiota bacterium]
MNSDDALSYDVVVIGGALSGAASAMLLLRQNSRATCFSRLF